MAKQFNLKFCKHSLKATKKNILITSTVGFIYHQIEKNSRNSPAAQSIWSKKKPAFLVNNIPHFCFCSDIPPQRLVATAPSNSGRALCKCGAPTKKGRIYIWEDEIPNQFCDCQMQVSVMKKDNFYRCRKNQCRVLFIDAKKQKIDLNVTT